MYSMDLFYVVSATQVAWRGVTLCLSNSLYPSVAMAGWAGIHWEWDTATIDDFIDRKSVV